MSDGIPIPNIPKPVTGFFSRLEHPIFGAFAFSWMLFNWDLLYLLAMGREKYSETISIIWTEHFLNSAEHRVFLYPAVWTALYLIFGPILSTGYKVGVAWIEGIILKIEPIPAFLLENAKSQLQQMELEKNSYQAAYNYTENVNDQQRNYQRLAYQSESNQKRVDALVKENTKLKANIQLFHAGTTEQTLREELDIMRKREQTVTNIGSLIRKLVTDDIPIAQTQFQVLERIPDRASLDNLNMALKNLRSRLQVLTAAEKEGFEKLKKDGIQ